MYKVNVYLICQYFSWYSVKKIITLTSGINVERLISVEETTFLEINKRKGIKSEISIEVEKPAIYCRFILDFTQVVNDTIFRILEI